MVWNHSWYYRQGRLISEHLILWRDIVLTDSSAFGSVLIQQYCTVPWKALWGHSTNRFRLLNLFTWIDSTACDNISFLANGLTLMSRGKFLNKSSTPWCTLLRLRPLGLHNPQRAGDRPRILHCCNALASICVPHTELGDMERHQGSTASHVANAA